MIRVMDAREAKIELACVGVYLCVLIYGVLELVKSLDEVATTLNGIV